MKITLKEYHNHSMASRVNVYHMTMNLLLRISVIKLLMKESVGGKHMPLLYLFLLFFCIFIFLIFLFYFV